MGIEFDEKKVVGVATIKKNITESDIENIIVTSFEGGSTYWMGLDNSKPEWDDQPEDEPLSTWGAKLLIDGKSIKMYDISNEDDDSDWVLTLEKLIKGFQLNCEQRPHDCDLEQGDATTADCIVQFALFGEVVYG